VVEWQFELVGWQAAVLEQQVQSQHSSWMESLSLVAMKPELDFGELAG